MRRWSTAWLCAAAIAWAACATTPPKSELYERVGGSKMPVAELRIRVRGLAMRFSGLIEAAADDIANDAGDAKTRMEMTRFKANAVPAIQSSLFEPDPVAALIDTWALLAQLQDAIVVVAGENVREREIAEARVREMEADLEAVWRKLTGREDVSQARDKVHRWAAEHPLTRNLTARESTVGLLAELTAGAGISALGAAAALVEDVGDLSARLDVEVATLPKQVRWQAEYMLLDTLTNPAYRDAAPDVTALMNLVVRMTALADSFNGVVERERRAVLGALDRERLGAQEFVTSERQAVLEDLRLERIAVLEALQQERIAVMDGVHQERVAAFADSDRMVRGWIDHGYDRATSLIDRAFLWMLVIAAVLVLGALGLLLRIGPRGPRPRP